MTQMELLPYSEAKRDRLEEELGRLELAYRHDHGIEVFLYWYKKRNILKLQLNDLNTEETSTFKVPNDKGLDAFEHPYAYGPPM